MTVSTSPEDCPSSFGIPYLACAAGNHSEQKLCAGTLSGLNLVESVQARLGTFGFQSRGEPGLVSTTPGSVQTNSQISRRAILLAGWILLSCLVFWPSLASLARISQENSDVSYVLFIPLISAVIVFAERRRILASPSYSWFVCGPLLLAALCISLLGRFLPILSSPDLRLSCNILSLILLWTAGFALFFGTAATKAAAFPLCLLVFMVPPPDFLFGRAIYLLQSGSAWLTGLFFDLLGVPALREGFVFHLSGVNIEIAKECSGIRSSMALLIVGLLAAYFRIKSPWKRAVFVGVGIFMMILKNGIRIATLTVLALKVDPRFLTGSIHHQGGVVFFVISLVLLWPVLLLLERTSGEKLSQEKARS